MEENIVLVGFMGSGKSTVGRELARRLGRAFLDTDELVERRAGMPVPEVFARLGEDGFRRLEAEAVAEAAAEGGRVIATGGGALLREENVQRLKATGRLYLLHASPADLLDRLEADGTRRRPLLAGVATRAGRLERIEALLAARAPAYARADEVVETTGRTVAAVAEEIIERAGAGAAPAVSMRVALDDRSYEIRIGYRILGELGARMNEALGLGARPGHRTPALVVTNPDIGVLYGRQALTSLEEAGFVPRLVRVPAGEESKCLEQAARLYDECVDAGLDRRSPVVALGGGVIGDLAGFVAATFLRGIPFVQVPTTLLAQVDSSVGGKVAVNHPRAKNLIGAFYQPRLVLADVALLRTLPPREFAAGMAEVIKHGVIADPAYFDFLEREAERIRGQDPAALVRLVQGSCRIKAAVVEEDERESWRRMILNFGHTVGHAVEAATGYGRFLHGEAVAIGMLAAGRLAMAARAAVPGAAGKLAWGEDEQERLSRLITAFGLPASIPAIPLAELLAAMALDKKSLGGDIRWVLPARIGAVEIVGGLPAGLVAETLVSMGARP